MCVGVCGWVLEATEGEAAAGVEQTERIQRALSLFLCRDESSGSSKTNREMSRQTEE